MFKSSNSVSLLTLVLCGVLSNNAQAQAYQNQTGNTGGNNGNQTSSTELSGVSDGPAVSTELGTLSDQIGTGFIGGNTDTDAFAGVNQDLRNTGQGSTRNFQNRNTTGNLSQLNQPRQVTQGTGVAAIRYRPQFRIGFELPRPSARNVDLKLSRSLTKLSVRKSPFESVVYQVNSDNSITLTGTVASEGEKQLAQLYFQMEPGVDQIVNRLEVAAPAPNLGSVE